jgi:hypothetical protein
MMTTDSKATIAGGLTGLGSLGLALESFKGCAACVPPVGPDYLNAVIYAVIGVGLLALGYFTNKTA